MTIGIAEGADLERLSRLEWLETDGLGNYAAGTVSGINTRRYHGLLVAETRPGAGRRVLCAKLEPTLFVGSVPYELGANQYADTIHPQGYHYLTEFRLDPWPIWLYEVGSAVLEVQVAMLHGVGATVVEYTLLAGDGPANLQLRPLVAGRDIHSTSVENWSFRRQVESHRHRLHMAPYGEGSELAISFPGGSFEPDGVWFYNFIYPRDVERGEPELEDLFNPGLILCTLHPGESTQLGLAAHEIPPEALAHAFESERERREALKKPAGGEPARERLLLSADAYRVSSGQGEAVVAGYPWFGPRWRDALVALPGLTLLAGRAEQGRRLLESAATAVPGALAAEQAGVDEPLWLTWAAQRYLERTGDLQPIQEAVLPVLLAVIEDYDAARYPGIWVDDDGLVCHGGTARPLTWMNAELGAQLATPREGKAVEVNALWHLTLRWCAELQGDDVLADRAAAVRESFATRWWNAQRQYLYDVIDGPTGDDGAVRPNALLAVAVDPELLPDELARAVVEVAADQLVTPLGVRTLAADDPRYRALYEGDARARHEAYHNGPAVPWLLAFYAAAALRWLPDGPTRVAALLDPLLASLYRYGLGHLAELHDGDGDQQPRGCFAQAWSLAAAIEIAALVDQGAAKG